MIEPKFKMGDPVSLKVGGPMMTVSAIQVEPCEQYLCTWFEECNPREANFVASDLSDVNQQQIGFVKRITE